MRIKWGLTQVGKKSPNANLHMFQSKINASGKKTLCHIEKKTYMWNKPTNKCKANAKMRTDRKENFNKEKYGWTYVSFRREKFFSHHSSDKSERGTNPTHKYFRERESIPHSTFKPWDTAHTNTFLSLALFVIFILFFIFVWMPNNCSFIKRNEKELITPKRANKQQKNENRFGNKHKRERERERWKSKK